MAETSNEKKLSLKIMVDVKAKRVVFAEADKEFVDFILNLMSLPLSSVTKVLLLHKKGMVGCLGALYKSIESLDTQCFESDIRSSSVYMPRSTVSVPLLSLHDCHVVFRSYYFRQNKCECGSKPEFTSSHNISAVGYVKGGAVYMVTDNLEVKPMSITLIKSHAKEFDVLEERQVEVGLQEGLAILKASMETNNVLTTVFLKMI